VLVLLPLLLLLLPLCLSCRCLQRLRPWQRLPQ
jgi:hypothetical protein